jgi:hypothetical protein
MIPIERIKAECLEAIALADRHDITDGPWERDGLEILAAQGLEVCSFGTSGFSKETDIANARHIAHARTFSPAAARATLSAITQAETMIEFGKSVGACGQDILNDICRAWEGYS